MGVLASHREPTFKFFLPNKLAGFAPQPFCLDATGATCIADVTNVVCFDMLIKLFTKLLDNLAVRNAGKGLPAIRPIRVTREPLQSGSIFRQCFGKFRDGVLVVGL